MSSDHTASGSTDLARRTRSPRRTRAGRFLLAFALAAGGVALTGAEPTAAVDAWTAAIDLSAPGGNATVPQVSANPTGNAVAVWLRNDGANDRVQAIRYTPGAGAAPGSWSAVTTLSAPGQHAIEPTVEVDDEGNAVVAWRRSNGTNFIVQVARYDAGSGAWSDVVDLSQPGGDARGPELSVDPDGNVTAAWYRFDTSPGVQRYVIETRRLLAGSSTWRPRVVLSNDDFNAVISRVAADADGNVVALWRQDENPDPVLETNIVYAARYDEGSGTWTGATQLSDPGVSANGIQLGVDPAGNAVAVWTRPEGAVQVVRARRFDVASGTWAPAVGLSAPGGNAFGPRVGADGQGIVTAVWRREDASGTSIVQASRWFPSTGAWTPPVDLSAAGQNALSPRVAVEPSGNATAVWVRRVGDVLITQSARLSMTTGTWGAATNLSAPGANAETPQTDVDADGNVIVVWARSNGANTIVQAAISYPIPGFTPVTPVRVFDTRPGNSPDALRDVRKGKVGGADVLQVRFADLPGGVTPATGLAAVSINVAVTNPDGPGYVTVFPCGARAEVASINFDAGQTVSNAVIAPVSPGGDVCFYGYAPTDIVVDINGWFPVGSSFTAVTPSRVLDTRPGQSPGAIRDVARTKVGPGNPLQVQVSDLVAGGSVLTPPTGVGAVSLNVAITNPQADGFVTVFPCGPRPFVASGNYVAGQTVSNAVIAPVADDGSICFYSLKPTDIVVDINGWFAEGGGFVPAGPERVVDTRGESANALVQVPVARVAPGSELRIRVIGLQSAAGTVTPPTGVGAVSLNVAAVNPSGDGFITVYPCGERELVASVNYRAGQIVPNAVIAPVSPQGEICVYSYAPTDVVIDINGWFPVSS